MVGGVGFDFLSASAREALSKASVKMTFRDDEVIYLQEDDAAYLYFIQSGFVRLSHLMEDGSAILCAILPKGRAFGELGVFEKTAHCDTATAIGPLVLSAVSTQSFHTLSEKFPELSQALSCLIAVRYRSYIELTRGLSLKSLGARLAQSLLRLGSELGEKKLFSGQLVVWIGPIVTQTDLGVMARGSRGNVNRLLKSWREEGIIAVKDRSIIILDPQALLQLTFQSAL